jgi:hypothetical protein
VWPLPPDDGSGAVDPDMTLTFRVIQRIFADPRLAGERVTVHAQNGVVTLLGTVGSLYARITAAGLARDTPGVTDICNRLELARVVAAAESCDPFDEIIAGRGQGGSIRDR